MNFARVMMIMITSSARMGDFLNSQSWMAKGEIHLIFVNVSIKPSSYRVYSFFDLYNKVLNYVRASQTGLPIYIHIEYIYKHVN